MSSMALALVLSLVQDKQDPKVELQRLEADYEKAQQAFYGALREAKTDEERHKIAEEKDPDGPFLKKFQDLAKRAAGTEAAAGALAQVFNLAEQVDQEEAAREAVKTLATSHLDSPVLEGVAASLQDHAEEEWCQGHLRKMMEKSPHKAVRAAAQFSLGCGLMAGEKATEAQKAEGKKLLEGVRKDYADTEFAKRAEGQLFEIEHLQVGKLAPDVEATDQDGKKFRLSEYRGKVVVLDFWGFW